MIGGGSRVHIGSGGVVDGGQNCRMAIECRGDTWVGNWDDGRVGLPPAGHLRRDNFA